LSIINKKAIYIYYNIHTLKSKGVFFMNKLFFTFTIIISFLNAYSSSKTCKLCHPTIYSEYQNSIHANSSIYNDKIFNAVWSKHPLKEKNDFKCAKCHTPSDRALLNGKAKLHPNSIQKNEPISCQNCHQIKEIHKGNLLMKIST